MTFKQLKMKKEENASVQIEEPEFKGNGSCCFGPKKWTSVIGWSGIALLLVIGVAGTVAAYAFGFSIFLLEKRDMTDDDPWNLCKLLWMFVFMGILMHTLLLVGNAMNERTFLLGWLGTTWFLLCLSIQAIASTITVEPPFETAVKLVVYGVIMGFPLYTVHRRYNELSEMDRKMANLEDEVDDSITF